jgi:hypothetical protein
MATVKTSMRDSCEILSREKADSPRMDAQYFSGRHDFILVYRCTEAFSMNRLATDGVPKHYNKTAEDGRQYYLKPLRAMGRPGLDP